METGSLILDSGQYTQVPTYELLLAAEQGFAGIDHRFLHALVDDPEKSIADLVRFGLETREDAREDLRADVLAILRHLRTPAAIPFFIEEVRRNGLDAPLEVIQSLREIGAPAIEPLLEFHRETLDEEESDAAFLLGSLGLRDPRILEVLTERLKTDPVDAGQCLVTYGDRAALPAMRAAAEGMQGEAWMKRSLMSAIEELEAGAAHPEQEDEPFDLWELYPEEADPRFDLLTPAETEPFLDSADADNRFGAVVMLSDSERPELQNRLLGMAREDPDKRVRGECWKALAMGWERPEIRAALKACLADETASDEERCGALQTLASRESEDAEVRRRILEFYGKPATRPDALEAMAVSFDPGYAKYFRQDLDDPDPGVRIQAMLGIGLLQMEADAPRLVPYFKDGEVRENALSAYAMSASCEPTRAGFRRLYQKIDTMAGGLTLGEEEAVKQSLNTRAMREELPAVFGPDGEALLDAPAVSAKVGRNDPCPCGSGKKYKKCCGG